MASKIRRSRADGKKTILVPGVRGSGGVSDISFFYAVIFILISVYFSFILLRCSWIIPLAVSQRTQLIKNR